MDPRSKMVASGSGAELDPVLVTALRLLHSKSPDSLDQLRVLRDEVFRQQHHGVSITSKVRQVLGLKQLRNRKLIEKPLS